MTSAVKDKAGAKRLAIRPLSARTTELIFLCVCVLWLVYRVLSSSFFAPYLAGAGQRVTRVAAYGVELAVVCAEVMKLLRGEYRRRDLLFALGAVAMGVAAFRFGNDAVLADIMTVFCLRSYRPRKVLLVATCAVGVTALVVLLGTVTGLLRDVVIYRDAEARHALGFQYVLFPAQYLFAITCAVCALRGRRLTLGGGLLLAFLNATMFLTVGSRLSSALGVVLALCTLIANAEFVRRARLGWLWSALSWSFLVALAISAVMVVGYGVLSMNPSDELDALDRMLSGRPSLAFKALRDMGVRLFGQKIAWAGNGLSAYGYNLHSANYNYVDNLIAHALVEQGIVYVAGLLALYTAATRTAYRAGNHTLLLAYAATAAHFLFDDLSLYTQYNLILLVSCGVVWAGSDGCVELERVTEQRPSLMLRLGRAGGFVALVGMLLVYVGVVGGRATTIASIAGRHVLIDPTGDAILSVNANEEGKCELSYRAGEQRGMLRLIQSDATTATFEFYPEEDRSTVPGRHDALTLITPIDVHEGGYVGTWKVVFVPANGKGRKSTFLDVRPDGTALFLQDDKRMITSGDDALRGRSAQLSWTVQDERLQLAG